MTDSNLKSRAEKVLIDFKANKYRGIAEALDGGESLLVQHILEAFRQIQKEQIEKDANITLEDGGTVQKYNARIARKIRTQDKAE